MTSPTRRGRTPSVRASLGFVISGWLILAPGVAPAWASPGALSSGGSATAPAAAGGDGPDTLEGINAQITATRGQLAALDAKLAAASEAFNAGRIRLGQARTAADEAEERVKRADLTVRDATQRRRGLSASAYRAGGLDTLSALLTGDPGGALDRAGALDALARRARTAEDQERLARVDLTEARANARTTLAAAQGAFDAVNAQKQTIETSAREQRTLLEGLVTKQGALERAARERAEAAARARREAEAAEARRVAEAAAREQAELRKQSELVGQAGAAFTATPVTPAAPAPAAPAPAPAGGGGAATAVAEAYRQLGKPYVWGAEGPDSFDCSGLTQWVWAKAGVQLTHYTGAQWNEGRRVSREELIPGDLVFFNDNLDHEGIYVGNGKMIHAPHTGAVVRVEDVWWSSFRGGVRPTG